MGWLVIAPAILLVGGVVGLYGLVKGKNKIFKTKDSMFK